MKRGRKSAAEREAAALAVIKGSFGTRPEPPEELTMDQKEIWRRVTAGEPPEFFATVTAQNLLRDYCRHVDEANRLSVALDSLDDPLDGDLPKYKTFLNLRDRETKAAADKATKLRLTNQSRYNPQKAARVVQNHAVTSSKPWEAEG